MSANSVASAFRHVSPILCVSDMSRAIAFYTLLGFQAHRYRNGDDYAFLTRGGFEIHLKHSDWLIEGRHPGNGVYFFLKQGTAAALEAEFRAAGAPILSPLAPREWKMNEFVLADPDANLLRFGEDIPAASASY
jgi:catechol 2,3-dioxygenase-like lactoylglutathione lyase family enzyme